MEGELILVVQRGDEISQFYLAVKDGKTGEMDSGELAFFVFA